MFFRLLKKISKNWGVFLSLFFGIIISLVIMNGISIYGNSLKDGLFQKDATEYERRMNENLGEVSIKDTKSDLNNAFSNESNKFNINQIRDIGFEVEEGLNVAYLGESAFWRKTSVMNNLSHFYNDNYDLLYIKDFEEHIEITDGRMFNNEDTNKNVIEVVVDGITQYNLNLKIGEEYNFIVMKNIKPPKVIADFQGKKDNGIPTKVIKVVGVYKFKYGDRFWKKGSWDSGKNHFVGGKDALNSAAAEVARTFKCVSDYFVDYSKFRYSERDNILEKSEKVRKRLENVQVQYELKLSRMLMTQNDQMKVIDNMLWIIQIPLLIIVFLYILMITGIIVERDKDEIALLKSRGATSSKIIMNYVFDGAFIVIVGILIAPFIGLEMAKYMSVVDGFLEFSGTINHNVYFTSQNILLTILGALVFLLALIIPVIKASKGSIINRKQSKVRIKISSWRKSFIDFILIGISIYGFSRFKNNQDLAEAVNLDLNSITLDPMIFVSATMLTFGLSLLFLRVYPFIIKIIFKLTKKVMPAHVYVSFSNLGRKVGKREYTMLFIMLTIALGIFNLKIARTTNMNVIDNIKYTTGAEVKMIGKWRTEKAEKLNLNRKTITVEESFLGAAENIKQYKNYIEPDFKPFTDLTSVEQSTKVMRMKDIRVSYSKSEFRQTELMGIIPNEFGKVAWMRDDLLPSHWYNYLNTLSIEPGAILFTSDMKSTFDESKLVPGKIVEVEIGGFNEKFVFGGYVDYWPTYVDKNKPMMIANFNYIYSKISRQPYEVWANFKPEKSYYDLLDELEDKKIGLAAIKTMDLKAADNIYLKAINSSITISFILSMFITLVGFLIYWCICIKDRELQFGILRSLGLKLNKVYGMIMIEQVMVTGVALGIAVLIGDIVSKVFLPIVNELVFRGMLAIPVFNYITTNDYILILGVFGVSVAIVILIVLRYVSKIKIDQAIKIGED